MIKFRISYSAIVCFLMAILGANPLSLFITMGLLELLMTGLILHRISTGQNIAVFSFHGFLLHQYATGPDVDFVEMLHMGGARILAALLGVFAFWYYIPSILIFLTTCADWVKTKKRRSK